MASVTGRAEKGIADSDEFEGKSDDVSTTEKTIDLLTTILERLDRIENMLGMDSQPEERWWAPDEVARKVDRAPLTVREWARLGKIPSRKDSRGRRWISDQVAQLIFRYQGLPPEEELCPMLSA